MDGDAGGTKTRGSQEGSLTNWHLLAAEAFLAPVSTPLAVQTVAKYF